MFGDECKVILDTIHRKDAAVARTLAKQHGAKSFRAVPSPGDRLNYQNVTVLFKEHSWYASSLKAGAFRKALKETA